ncbi:RNA recognition motif domain-containing protein [Algibacillus agarilyticus]|uniref:RNA recognition motif domain-containing protein n=1 Tax=Algibacillus agarilyticus TaxID=2234133 RepID=UPI000DCFB89A|nr:RNA-binding protein [Algibacillus agarilyticus]
MSIKVKQLSVSVILAIVGFILLPVIGVSIESNITLSLGILIGGFVSSFISPSTATSEVNSDKPTKAYKGPTKTLYVGNLPYRANEASVRELFGQFGDVISVRLMRDRNTGKRKGFGFVEIAEKDAEKAISSLNDAEFQSRSLKVREAKERPAPADNASAPEALAE